MVAPEAPGVPAGTRAESLHLGLDLGGTNLKWAVLAHGETEWRRVDNGQVATRIAGGPAGIVAQMVAAARDACDRHPGLASIGVGVPGRYHPAAGTTRFLPNVPGDWADRPVAEPLRAATGLPAALINDARAFGLAELRLGAGQGASSMIGLTLGTGVGGAVAVDGRIHLGRDGSAGEIGHLTIDADGPICGCGNRGCLEAYARAAAVAAACGAPTVEEAVRRAQRGDERARHGLADAARYLAIGIANAVALLSPDRVVIGGGVAAAGEILFAPIRAELAPRMTMTTFDVACVVPALLGTWAGSIGAAVHGAESRNT